MDFEWPASVRANVFESHALLIHSGSLAEWSVAFATGVRDFNKLHETCGLKLRLKIVAQESMAHVLFNAAGPEVVDHPLHGETTYPTEDDPHARVLVQKTPRVLPSAPERRRGVSAQAWRMPGDTIKSVVVAHELLHACGLHEHCAMDMFAEALVPEFGRGADRMRIPKTARLLPPLYLSDATKARLRDLWT
jgi:hypothetical protein